MLKEAEREDSPRVGNPLTRDESRQSNEAGSKPDTRDDNRSDPCFVFFLHESSVPRRLELQIRRARNRNGKNVYLCKRLEINHFGELSFPRLQFASYNDNEFCFDDG